MNLLRDVTTNVARAAPNREEHFMATVREIQAAMSGFPRNLTWHDFRVVQNSPSPPTQAWTSALWSLTAWSVKVVKGKYHVHGARVNVSLDNNNTWAVPSVRTNANLLRHEQGHYDINGLIARDVIRKILDLSLDVHVVAALKDAGKTPHQHQNFAFQHFKNDIDTYVQEANALSARLQTNPRTGADGIYEVQTNHSQNTTGQVAWDVRLQRMKVAWDGFFQLNLAMEGII
jgi:hypothetical protein